MNNGLMTTESAAKYLGGISPATVQWWRAKRRGPIYVKVGRKVFYRQADLDAFLDAGEIFPPQR